MVAHVANAARVGAPGRARAPTGGVPLLARRPTGAIEVQTADGEGTNTAAEIRAPGSDLVLPANPLMNLTDESLEGFVDCTLYEETATFIRLEDGTTVEVDEVAPPPPRSRTGTHEVVLNPFAGPALPRTRTATSQPVPITGAYALTPQGLRPLTIPPPISTGNTIPPPITGAYTAAIDPASGTLVAVPADAPNTGVYVRDASGVLVPRTNTGGFMIDANGALVARGNTGVYVLDGNGVPVPRTTTGTHAPHGIGVYAHDGNGVAVPRTATGAQAPLDGGNGIARTATGAPAPLDGGNGIARTATGAQAPLDGGNGIARTATGVQAPLDGGNGIVRTATGVQAPLDGGNGIPRTGAYAPLDGGNGAPRTGAYAPLDGGNGAPRTGAYASLDGRTGADGGARTRTKTLDARPLVPEGSGAQAPLDDASDDGGASDDIDVDVGAADGEPVYIRSEPPPHHLPQPQMLTGTYTAAIDPTSGALVAVPAQPYTTAIDPTSGAVVAVPVAPSAHSGVFPRPRPVSGLYTLPIAPGAPGAQEPQPQPSRAIAEELLARPRPPRARWLVIAGSAIGAIVIAVLIVALARRGSGGGNDASEGQTSKSAPPAVNLDAAPAPATGTVDAAAASAAPTTAPDAEIDDVPDKPESSAHSGLPVVGAGPCKLEVTSEPAGSTVTIDGNAAGPTPIVVAAECGAHRLDVAHARYATSTQNVTLVAEKADTVHVTLKRPTHAVTVVTVPAGATVYIEGRRAGTSPTMVQLMGYYGMNVTVEKAGWKKETQYIYSKSNPDKVTIWLRR
ncbi:MAG: PEGA domain-containing protein [Deltaproteobacteria bacterium]|nr:PEGA domain-containing protein [Deltaproteobacteria bacterium]